MNKTNREHFKCFNVFIFNFIPKNYRKVVRRNSIRTRCRDSSRSCCSVSELCVNIRRGVETRLVEFARCSRELWVFWWLNVEFASREFSSLVRFRPLVDDRDERWFAESTTRLWDLFPNDLEAFRTIDSPGVCLQLNKKKKNVELIK